jgi:hypothetical protein
MAITYDPVKRKQTSIRQANAREEKRTAAHFEIKAATG